MTLRKQLSPSLTEVFYALSHQILQGGFIHKVSYVKGLPERIALTCIHAAPKQSKTEQQINQHHTHTNKPVNNKLKKTTTKPNVKPKATPKQRGNIPLD